MRYGSRDKLSGLVRPRQASRQDLHNMQTDLQWLHPYIIKYARHRGYPYRRWQRLETEVQIMHSLLEVVEVKAREANTVEERHMCLMAAAYVCICFVLSLRSPGGLLMADLEDLLQNHDPSTLDEVVVSLLDRCKGEHHTKQHLLICCATTGYGI